MKLWRNSILDLLMFVLLLGACFAQTDNNSQAGTAAIYLQPSGSLQSSSSSLNKVGKDNAMGPVLLFGPKLGS